MSKKFTQVIIYTFSSELKIDTRYDLKIQREEWKMNACEFSIIKYY